MQTVTTIQVNRSLPCVRGRFGGLYEPLPPLRHEFPLGSTGPVFCASRGSPAFLSAFPKLFYRIHGGLYSPVTLPLRTAP